MHIKVEEMEARRNGTSNTTGTWNSCAAPGVGGDGMGMGIGSEIDNLVKKFVALYSDYGEYRGKEVQYNCIILHLLGMY